MLRLVVAILMLLAAPLAVPARAQQTTPAGARVALVVGIGAYQNASPLRATPNDARTVAQTLAALGFTMVGGGPLVDTDKASFDAAIQEFGRMARGADIALFYFSGHGMQWNGSNWLIPRDAPPLGRPETVAGSRIEAEAVLAQMAAAQPRLSIMILDACRNDPYRSSTSRVTGAIGTPGGPALQPGLAPMRAPRGTVIAYATQPGNTSLDGPSADGNSPYTAALLQTIREPGLPLFDMFNRASLRTIQLTNGHQEPWLALSPIEGEFYFVPRGAQPPVLAGLPQPGQVRPGQGAAPVQAPNSPFAIPGQQQPAPAQQQPQAPRPPGAGPQQAGRQDASFVLVNLSGRSIGTLQASLSSDANWGPNRLRSPQLGQGQRAPLQFPPGSCQVDVQVTYADGQKTEIRNLDTCRFSTMVLTPQGQLVPANADVTVVNATGQPIVQLQASLATENDWGSNRLSGPLPPNGQLQLQLPQGQSCDVDIRATFANGQSREWRNQDTCAIDSLPLR